MLNLQLEDTSEHFVLNLENCALTHVSGSQDANADATLVLDRRALEELLLQTTQIGEAIAAKKVRATGEASAFQQLMDLMDRYEHVFEIIEPRSSSCNSVA